MMCSTASHKRTQDECPLLNPPQTKKSKLNGEDDHGSDLPPPCKPSDYTYDEEKHACFLRWVEDVPQNKKERFGWETISPYIPCPKDAMYRSIGRNLRDWASSNRRRSERLGFSAIMDEMVTVPRIQFNVIPATTVVYLSSGHQFQSSEMDCAVQLLNMQNEAYPTMFPSTKWTCVGSLYSDAVRRISGTILQGTLDEAMDPDMRKIVSGAHEKWPCKSWDTCDYVFGYDRPICSQWIAYSYDFRNRVVNVYDSMLGSAPSTRQYLFDKHAEAAPKLYNLSIGKRYFNPDEPFKVVVVDVPQQEHASGMKGYNLGTPPVYGRNTSPEAESSIYCLKFLECLTMQVDLKILHVEQMENYRMKILLNMLKWSKHPERDDIYEMKDIKLERISRRMLLILKIMKREP